MSQISYVKTACIVICATTLFAIGDTAAKKLMLVEFDPVFVAWARIAVGMVFLLPFCNLKREELKLMLDWRIIFRGLLVTCSFFCIMSALRTEPMANVFGAFFVGPIVSYFLSAILLKEKITPARTVLLFISFLGVLLVVKPNAELTVGIGFALLAGCLHGSYLVSTRWLANEFRPRLLLISQLIIGSFLLLPFAAGSPIGEINSTTTILVLFSAATSTIGNYMLVIANKNAPASIIAPFVYSLLISGTIMGYLAFGNFPDTLGFIGITIIVISGVSSLWFATKALKKV